jgi:hypothetical protein
MITRPVVRMTRFQSDRGDAYRQALRQALEQALRGSSGKRPMSLW